LFYVMITIWRMVTFALCLWDITLLTTHNYSCFSLIFVSNEVYARWN
jgi:hypothetical protein